jgi:hypothetical protein
VTQVDKFRGHFFAFPSSWTKVAQADKLKGRRCILLKFFPIYMPTFYAWVLLAKKGGEGGRMPEDWGYAGTVTPVSMKVS